jgi:flavin-dependent dehydrogenase
LRLEPALALFPELAARLRFAQPASSERGAVTACRRFPKVCTSRIALSGDASGSVDAIVGEGLGLAFRQAEALARALASGDLSSYPAAHARIRRGPAFLAQLLLMLDRGETLRRRAISAFSAHPSAFAGLLAAHTGLL